MRVLCLVKQVPARATLGVDPVTGSLVRDNDTITNPPDERAIEAALRLDDAEITLLSMGPKNAENMLRQLAAYKVTRLALVCDRAFAGSDTYATAKTLKRAIEYLGGFDLILVGTRAVDGETGQVGPEVAAMLDIPCIPDVAELSVDGDTLFATRATQYETARLECRLPALCTISMGSNALRPPSLLGLRRASKAEIVTLTNNELSIPQDECGAAGSLTNVVKTKTIVPEKRSVRDISSVSDAAQSMLLAVARAKGRDENAE